MTAVSSLEFSISFSGGIDSNKILPNSEDQEATTSADNSNVSNSGTDSLNECDDTCSNVAQEDKENYGPQVAMGKREQIAKFPEGRKEKKMFHKLSLERQQLSYIKDDLALKRKMCERE